MIININSNIAVAHSINAAIFLQQLSQWTFRNLANNHHIYDGHVWSFNTLEAYEKIFPFWNRRQLETLINNLVKDGLILKGNYNKHKYDRTCWYALSYMAMNFFPELMKPEFLDAMLGLISQKCEMETPDFGGNTIMENHFTKMRNGDHENVTPIPTYYTTYKDTPIVPSGDEKNFSDFWEIYPVKKGRKKCEDKWKRLNLDAKASVIIDKVKQQIVGDDQWKRGFVPNPYTYINGSLWEDELSIAPRNGKHEQKKYY